MLFAIAALRFLHFGEALDAPHVWRQSDTGQYIRDFHQNGIDLFHPKVCWMGGHGTLVLEFPLPEAIAAIGYGITGEDHRTARIIFLVFFLVSCIYLWRTLRLIFKNGVPEVATILYAAAPLSIFYSRAVHIDFTAVAFSHIMLYFLIKAIQQESRADLIKGVIWGTLAVLVKAPYVFYFTLPLLIAVHRSGKWKFALRNMFWAIIPVVAFFLWRSHVSAVNGAAPDWGFMLSYNRFTNMDYWYYGNWSMRWEWDLWDDIFQRIRIEILGWVGMIAATVGLIFSFRGKKGFIALSWLLGSMIYVFVFFNLNVRHNYYQIPLIAPLCLLAGIGIVKFSGLLQNWKWLPILALVLAFIFESYQSSELRYFRQPHVQQAISQLIMETSEPDDLVIVSTGSSTPQFPNILYGAHRKGWSYPVDLQNPTVLYNLKDEGASKAYFITRNPVLWGERGRLFRKTPGAQKITLNELGLNAFVIPL